MTTPPKDAPVTEGLTAAQLEAITEEAFIEEAERRGLWVYRRAEAATAARSDEIEYLTWDGRRLVVTVTDDDPGDMGEPRSVESDGVTYLTVRAVLTGDLREASGGEVGRYLAMEAEMRSRDAHLRSEQGERTPRVDSEIDAT
jgi:hypothetical protein